MNQNLAIKILYKKSHAKNRPRRTVFQFCICTDSLSADLKTDILVQRAKDSVTNSLLF